MNGSGFIQYLWDEWTLYNCHKKCLTNDHFAPRAVKLLWHPQVLKTPFFLTNYDIICVLTSLPEVKCKRGLTCSLFHLRRFEMAAIWNIWTIRLEWLIIF